MKSNTKALLHDVMCLAWQFVRQNGFSMSEALQTAWRNIKLCKAMATKVVKFLFQKVDGSARLAFGTLKSDIVPETKNERKPSPSVQVYFDTEKSAWRCFKRSQLLSVSL